MSTFIQDLPLTPFLVIVGVFTGMAALLAFAASRSRKIAAAIKATPTSNVNFATDGYVEFEGTEERIYAGDPFYALGQFLAAAADDEDDDEPDRAEVPDDGAGPEWDSPSRLADFRRRALAKTKRRLTQPTGRPYVLSTTPQAKLLEVHGKGSRGALRVAIVPLSDRHRLVVAEVQVGRGRRGRDEFQFLPQRTQKLKFIPTPLGPDDDRGGFRAGVCLQWSLLNSQTLACKLANARNQLDSNKSWAERLAIQETFHPTAD